MSVKRRLAVCYLLPLCMLTACGEPEVAKPVRPVRAIKVGDVTSVSERSFPGRARATEEVNLSFRVTGPLIELPVKVGDTVTKDQVLARIDPRDFEVAVEDAQGKLGQAEAELDAMREGARPEELEQLKAAVQRAQAEYERARNEFQRAALLIKTKTISDADYDLAHQTALKAQAELRTAQEALQIGEVGAREEDIRAKEAELRSFQAALTSVEDRVLYTHLKAPFEGEVAATYVENFEMVQEKQQIVRLLDISQIEMVINVPESLILNAEYVKNIACVFDAFPETKIEGVVIKEIGTEASQTTRTYPVTLVMDQPDPSTGVKILPGMAGRASGTAELPDQAAEQGFEIPESAVFSGDDGKQYVWVIDEGGTTVRKKLVTPGRLTAIGIRVTGLDAGQWIATAGVDYLQEGQKIKILQESGGESQ